MRRPAGGVLVRDKARLALGLLLLAVILQRPLNLLTRTLLPGIAERPALYYAALIVDELVLYGLPAALLLRRAKPQRQRLAPGQWRRMSVTCVVMGMAAQYLFQAVSWLWSNLLALLPGQVTQGAVMMPRSLPEGLLAFCALAVTPALTEEALFRGGVFPCLLKQFSRRDAFLLTAGSFALMHGSLTGLPAHVGVGLAATGLLVSYDSLGAPIAFHLGYNAMALAYSMLPALQVWEWMPWGALIGASMAAILLIALGLGRLRGKLSKEKPAQASREDAWLAIVLMALLAAAYVPELWAVLGGK